MLLRPPGLSGTNIDILLLLKRKRVLSAEEKSVLQAQKQQQ